MVIPPVLDYKTDPLSFMVFRLYLKGGYRFIKFALSLHRYET